MQIDVVNGAKYFHKTVAQSCRSEVEKAHIRKYKRMLKFRDRKVYLMCVCPCIVVIWVEENQLDVTQCFIELVIRSTCFGHVYAHHQELATILPVWHVACSSWLLVVGRSGAGKQAMRPDGEMPFDCSRTASLNPDA